MADCFSKEKRSHLMAQIKSKGTQPEARLGALLHLWLSDEIILESPAHVTGKPDYAIERIKLAIFLDGCFFHGCPKHYRQPDQNKDYWIAKLKRNRARDRLVSKSLRAEGWRVLRIWEHELRSSKMPGRERVRRRVRRAVSLCPAAEPMLLAAESRAPYSPDRPS